MKKLFLSIIVLGLFLCGSAYADLIMFDKCYPIPEFKNYKTYKNSSESAFDEWSMEINLKKDKITRTTIWKDEEVESGKNYTQSHLLIKIHLLFSHFVSKDEGKLCFQKMNSYILCFV